MQELVEFLPSRFAALGFLRQDHKPEYSLGDLGYNARLSQNNFKKN